MALVSAVDIGDGSLTVDEICEKGRTFYYRDIMPKIEGAPEGAAGRFVAIDVLTGEYETADNGAGAMGKLRDRLPKVCMWLERIGYSTAYSMGGGRVQ